MRLAKERSGLLTAFGGCYGVKLFHKPHGNANERTQENASEICHQGLGLKHEKSGYARNHA
jgi:hypothetical protein